jgi:hypothetical protein
MKGVSVMLGIVMSAGALLSGQAAQAPAAASDDGKREFTISGCMLRSGYAGYQVDEAKVDAIDGKRLPAAPAAAPAPFPARWILEGGGNLGARVGEKVEVVGRSDWQAPSASNEEPPDRAPRLEVKSVKTLAMSCT